MNVSPFCSIRASLAAALLLLSACQPPESPEPGVESALPGTGGASGTSEEVRTVVQAVDIPSNYDSGIWAIPSEGNLYADRLYGVSAQSCADLCSARQDCTGFYAFTDWDTCQLYGAQAETAGRIGPWNNIKMYWKRKSVNAQQYASGIWAVPNEGYISDTLYGYTPAQCSQLCESKADCTGFYAFTDRLQCRLHGPASEKSATNGPWTNLMEYQRKRATRAFLVDLKVLTTSSGGNEFWSEAHARNVLAEATKLMQGEVAFSLATYTRVVDDARYNGNSQYDILLAYGNTTQSGRMTVYVSSPNTYDSAGVAWQGAQFAPYFVMRSRQNNGSASDLDETARIFLHEFGHNLNFSHGAATEQDPFHTDWYWNVAQARQVVTRLADWSRLYLMGTSPNIKTDSLDCGWGWGVPTQGALTEPQFYAPTALACAARCAQTSECASSHWRDDGACVLYGADSIGHTGMGWSNVEVCWKKSDGTDLALARPTLQSSTDWGGAASRAVDGNMDGNFNAGSVTHTATESQPWWQVDLQSSRFINKVVVRNRTDCCSDRLNNFKVLVSEDGSTWQAYSFPNVAPQQTEFPVGRTGRFVKVQLDGSGVLSLAEVKVL
ncbi:discoidin domain-containing protein [Vitiosangium sp. GDMCC 1.1324]|uniref:discoidin domain-containing protein n=1 Tax=Vitiosangium sp. (strain GDMCC 1.1324) TaxID=2138576 RepID=UPI000D34BB68|nr:discoidin domain-containing protein [Vitiosangium sp. GDMCC 1.1324]PTL82692.1 hypothetical protein DAT35_18105 [Vitiosangium sp. GDMCC 1.1324]